MRYTASAEESYNHKETDISTPLLAICSYNNLSVRDTDGLTFINARVKCSLVTWQLSTLRPESMSTLRQIIEASLTTADKSAPLMETLSVLEQGRCHAEYRKVIRMGCAELHLKRNRSDLRVSL